MVSRKQQEKDRKNKSKQWKQDEEPTEPKKPKAEPKKPKAEPKTNKGPTKETSLETLQEKLISILETEKNGDERIQQELLELIMYVDNEIKNQDQAVKLLNTINKQSTSLKLQIINAVKKIIGYKNTEQQQEPQEQQQEPETEQQEQEPRRFTKEEKGKQRATYEEEPEQPRQNRSSEAPKEEERDGELIWWAPERGNDGLIRTGELEDPIENPFKVEEFFERFNKSITRQIELEMKTPPRIIRIQIRYYFKIKNGLILPFWSPKITETLYKLKDIQKFLYNAMEDFKVWAVNAETYPSEKDQVGIKLIRLESLPKEVKPGGKKHDIFDEPEPEDDEKIDGDYLPTPTWLRGKGIINVKLNQEQKENWKNRCFETALIVSLYSDHIEEKNKKIFTSYESIETETDFTMLGPNIKTDDERIEQFEEVNKISVYIFEESRKYKETPNLFREPKHDYEKKAYLFRIRGEANNHYASIVDLDRFLNSDKSDSHKKRINCPKCFIKHETEEKAKNCFNCSERVIELPKKYQKERFTPSSKMMKHPFIISADLENYLRDIDEEKIGALNPKMIHEGKDNSAALFTISTIKELSNHYWIYRGENRMKALYDELTRLTNSYLRWVEDNTAEMIITEEEQAEFEKAENCYLCKINFEESGKKKNRDHCHTSGKYRGAACPRCNLNLKMPKSVPVFIHNLSGYDGTFIIKELIDAGFKPDSKKCMIETSERFFRLQFKDCKFYFVDSYRLLNKSLEKLMKSFKPENWRFLKSEFPGVPEEFIMKKGVLPYSKIKDPSYFEKVDFPPIEDFYNDLSRTPCDPNDYDRALRLWNFLKEKAELTTDKGGTPNMNFGVYHDFYLKMDVIQLADLLEANRDFILENAGLDPAQFLSQHSLAYQAGIKSANRDLDYLYDEEMWNFYKRGNRGGFSEIMYRYAIANNKHCPDFKPKKDVSWLMSVDANANYAWAMMKPLPIGDFKWRKTLPEINKLEEFLDERTYDINDEDYYKYGYTFEVDFEIPEHLHDIFRDLVPFPEHLIIPEQLRSYHSNKLQEHGHSRSLLIGHLYNHKNYVIDGRMLLFALRLGIKVKKIHRILVYKQEPFLKEHVNKWVQLRLKASKDKNDFYEDLCKQMLNSFYGMTLLDKEKFKSIQFCYSEKELEKYTNRKDTGGISIYNKNVNSILLPQYKKLRLDSLIYIGFTIQELSKLLIYEFYFNKLMKTYTPERLRLCSTATDSLTFLVKTEDIYKDIENNKKLRKCFDFSNLPVDHPLYSIKRKKLPGYFKDEGEGKIFHQFIGLQANHKILTFNTGEETKKASGVSQAAIKNQLSYKDYKEALDKGAGGRVEYGTILTKDHTVITYEVVKEKVLSANDEKRYVLKDGLDSRPYGHREIPDESELIKALRSL